MQYASAWPALSKWRRVEYLARECFARSVPVELGEHYMASGWSCAHTLAHTYIRALAGPRVCACGRVCACVRTLSDGQPAALQPASTTYMAQYDLLRHVPALRRDIVTPDLSAVAVPKACHHGSYAKRVHGDAHSEGGEEAGADAGVSEDDVTREPIVNAWIGPAGTYTPAHTDPYSNIFVQVVGHKRFFLFPPTEEVAAGMAPHEGIMSNTSQVDVRADMDSSSHPEFMRHAAPHCIVVDLHPGDALFMPPKMWHAVQALSNSISLSFWW